MKKLLLFILKNNLFNIVKLFKPRDKYDQYDYDENWVYIYN